MSSEMKTRGPVLPVVIVVVLAALVAGIYFFWVERERQAAQAPATTAAPAPEVKAEPQIRHPIPQTSALEAQKPLPSLAESDEPIRDAAATLIDRTSFEKLFNTVNLVRRVVV